MMKKITPNKTPFIRRFIVVVISTFIPAAAGMAAGNSPGEFFFDVGAGQVNYSADSFASSFDNRINSSLRTAPFSLDTDDSDIGLRFSGGYQLNSNVAATFSFTDLGEYVFGGTSVDGTTVTSYEVATDAFTVEIGGRYAFPLMSDKFVPYVNAGLLIWSLDSELSVNSNVTGSSSDIDEDSGLYIGIGLGATYFFNDFFGMGAAWNHYDFNDAFKSGSFKMDFLSLSVYLIP
ncbi:MAG: outer membrane beta-barrel protein [Gammaproteobacteria bacterium]|jgi:outer membrane protein W